MFEGPTVTISVDLSGIGDLRDKIDAQLRGSEQGPVADAVTQWAFRTKSFLQLRYEAFSRGGGDWAPLSERTKAARRNEDKDSIAILIDVGLLVGALNPLIDSAPGALSERIEYGIVVGYGGTDSHGGDEVTIADLATFHQEGTPVMPARPIVVAPSDEVQELMAQDLARGIQRLIDSI